jgi:tripartite-type tricarboxylate transporter receptor subunit TctC
MKRALVFACLLAAAAVSAQDYPSKPIRFILPYPAGSSNDFGGRVVAQQLADNIGQAVVVDNRTGAGGTLGTETAAHAPPDGYTMVMGGTGTLALSPNLQKKLGYEPLRDFAPVTLLVNTPYVLVVNPSLQVNSVRDLIALAKAKPGEINYASGGNGSVPHLAGELFKSMAGVRMVHVPYKGSVPGINDVIAGQVPVIFTGIASVIAHIRSGRLRPLGVTGSKRSSALPDVPTVAESGVPGYEVGSWVGALVPVKTPAAVVTKLNSEIVKVLAMRNVRERLVAEGLEPLGGTPAQFAAHIKSESAKWGKVLREAGIRAD